MTDKSLLVNVEQWIEENKHAFNPPVCNKLMHFCQLNIMFVGGPNTRKDYHIEEGEELFFQVKGDMCLKVVENGKHKDVHIKEGEMFLLPARIPHSPQRQADTVGLVVERRRLTSETDCLRYYVENTTNILFERWFYCQDLGTQLVPVIKDSVCAGMHPRVLLLNGAGRNGATLMQFMASMQAKTGKPDPNEVFRDPPFQMNTLNVMSPFCFKSWLDKHRAALGSGGPIDLFGAQFETEAMVFGPGETANTTRQSDTWIWQLEGESTVTANEKTFTLKSGDSVLIPEHQQYQWQRGEGTVALFVAQNPERKRP